MTRREQIADAEANLKLLQGNVMGALAVADLSGGGAVAPTFVLGPEVDGEGNYTGSLILERSGVRYRVSVDYA